MLIGSQGVAGLRHGIRFSTMGLTLSKVNRLTAEAKHGLVVSKRALLAKLQVLKAPSLETRVEEAKEAWKRKQESGKDGCEYLSPLVNLLASRCVRWLHTPLFSLPLH